MTINKEEACNRYSFTSIDFWIVSPSQIINTHSIISDQGETVLTLIVVVVFDSLHVICQTYSGQLSTNCMCFLAF